MVGRDVHRLRYWVGVFGVSPGVVSAGGERLGMTSKGNSNGSCARLGCMGREAGFSATQFCKKAQTAPVEMTTFGVGEEDKGNGNYKSRSLRDDNQKNNGRCKCKCKCNGKSKCGGSSLRSE